MLECWLEWLAPTDLALPPIRRSRPGDLIYPGLSEFQGSLMSMRRNTILGTSRAMRFYPLPYRNFIFSGIKSAYTLITSTNFHPNSFDRYRVQWFTVSHTLKCIILLRDD